MKINKRRPSHWFYLLAFAAQAVLGLLLRRFTKKTAVILYGHKLNGNLLAIYRACPHAVFLSMDPAYCRELKRQGIRYQWACSFGATSLLASAQAVISDHGLHSLEILLPAYRRTGLKFFDVWHGIPYKGFDADDFRLQHQYDETWVASPLNRQLYIERFGFAADRVAVTGYARTDVLVQPKLSNAEIRQTMVLPPDTPLILFAPTWAQDEQGRNLFPFGHTADEFLSALSTLAQKHKAHILLRTHLNSRAENIGSYPNIIPVPASQWPDAERILQISDILICDWSSISFDYLLLDRPTFFLDIPAPFRKGFSLGPEYRFGPIVSSLPELIAHLDSTLDSSTSYARQYGERQQAIREKVYGSYADGQATRRCMERLTHHLDSEATGESSR